MQANFRLLTRVSAIGGGLQMPFTHWQTLYNLVCHSEQKNYMIYIFAVIVIFLLPSDNAVDKMSVGHTNENGIYIHFILFQNY